jgi:hypothetical protein
MPAEGVFSLIWLLIALPLAGAIVLLFGGRRTNSWGPYLGVLTVSASAVLGVLMLLGLLDRPAEERTVEQTLFTWVFVGDFQADIPLQMWVYPARTGTPLPDVFTQHAQAPSQPVQLSPEQIDAGRDGWLKAWTDAVLR